MPCCKCEEFGWHDRPEDMVYKDEAGKDYCLFHAPADKKGMSVDEFNERVFARIDAVKARNKAEGKNKGCNLSSTIFPGDISFRAYGEDNPLPGINFSSATFSGEADFGRAKFSDRADFGKATFGGAAYFWEATFSDGATFSGATFNRMASFRKATFGSSACFWGATFSGMANFVEATFTGLTYFVDATFNHPAEFWGATFSVGSAFQGVNAEKNAMRMHSLNSATLSNLSFTSMETECFSFKGCDWPVGGLWQETTGDPDYKACEELYRSLKQKAASEHDQPMVSKWHYREKLMALEQIKAKRGWRGNLGLTGLYYWCSGFGEDPAQAFRVLAGLLGFAFLALCGFKLWETGMETFRPDWGKILEIPAELLALVPFVKTTAVTATSDQSVFTALKATITNALHILVAVQLALFAFALRNRFRR